MGSSTERSEIVKGMLEEHHVMSIPVDRDSMQDPHLKDVREGSARFKAISACTHGVAAGGPSRSCSDCGTKPHTLHTPECSKVPEEHREFLVEEYALRRDPRNWPKLEEVLNKQFPSYDFQVSCIKCESEDVRMYAGELICLGCGAENPPVVFMPALAKEIFQDPEDDCLDTSEDPPAKCKYPDQFSSSTGCVGCSIRHECPFYDSYDDEAPEGYGTDHLGSP